MYITIQQLSILKHPKKAGFSLGSFDDKNLFEWSLVWESFVAIRAVTKQAMLEVVGFECRMPVRFGNLRDRNFLDFPGHMNIRANHVINGCMNGNSG